MGGGSQGPVSPDVRGRTGGPLTRDTLRWFVHEERDSRALLWAEYERIEARAATGSRAG